MRSSTIQGRIASASTASASGNTTVARLISGRKNAKDNVKTNSGQLCTAIARADIESVALPPKKCARPP